MNREQLQKLTELRVKEATILYENKCFDGAYYLLGYAVECALKSCIAKKVQQYDFPDKKLANESYTHDLKTLLKIAELKEELDNLNDSIIKMNWSMIINSAEEDGLAWSETVRYIQGIDSKQAEDFFYAVTDQNKGILQWLQKYW